MPLHATIDRVTDRIRARSAASRAAYLAKIARQAEEGPRRAAALSFCLAEPWRAF